MMNGYFEYGCHEKISEHKSLQMNNTMSGNLSKEMISLL